MGSFITETWLREHFSLAHGTEVRLPEDGRLTPAARTLLDEKRVEQLEASGVQSIKVRSTITCESRHGVCGHCYGRDLARGHLVNIGEAVGIIAAQSIGEPGTQLTMRTFHIGGIAQGGQQSFIAAAQEGVVEFQNESTLENAQGELIVMARNPPAQRALNLAFEKRQVHKQYEAVVLAVGATLTDVAFHVCTALHHHGITAVLTGGSAVMPGMIELGEDIFLKPVRRGLPKYSGALADMVAQPRAATVMGLLDEARLARLRGYKVAQKSGSMKTAFGRFKDFIVGNF